MKIDCEEPNMVKKIRWTAVVLTCSNKDWTHALQNELERRQAKGQIDKETILLTIEDPKTNVGSGGATINALLTVVEHISARQGFTVINSDVLNDAFILILHHGRTYSYDSCGRAFTALPAKFKSSQADSLVCNIDLLLEILTQRISSGSPPGVWVSSTDMLLAVPTEIDTSWHPCDACLFTMPASVQYAKDHGVCKINTQNMVEDILYQKDVLTLESCQRLDGTVPVLIAIVYLSHSVSEKLLSFYTKPPLDACTYFGLDSGQPPLKLSLFFDILLPMTTAVSEKDFVQGERSGTFGKPGSGDSAESRLNMTMARKLLWKELHEYRLKACMIEDGKFHYLTDVATEHKNMLVKPPVIQDNSWLTWSPTVQADINSQASVGEDTTIINSVLKREVTVGSKSVVCHCSLSGNVTIGSDSFFSGVNIEHSKVKKPLQFADSMMMQGFHINLKTLGTTRKVFTVHGRHDNVQIPTWKAMATFCNEPWLVFLSRTGILPEDLWATETDNDQQTVLTARLFPVFHAMENVGLKELLWLQGQIPDTSSKDFLKRWRTSWRLSLAEILSFVDLEAELQWRNMLFYQVAEQEVENALTNSLHQGFNSLYTSATVDGFSKQILAMLDKVASITKDPGIAARALANIADVLGSMAGSVGGLRSGPAANQSWRKAFNYLESKDFALGVAALGKEREQWLGRPDHLIRAARHYEGAAQILIRQAVMTAKEFFKLGNGTLPPLRKWIRAECPARIDISGGWSDTPPITYEHGGAVTIAGVLVNGKRPIGCRVRRIEEPVVRLELIGDGEVSTVVVCHELSDMENYFQPHAPGALVKAAFVCCNMIDLNSSMTLQEQLKSSYGGGFEVQSWSNLPHGSGMGTSSILAGAVLAALLTAAGKTYDTKGLIHAVLYLEQLLTTGGGWQDQIGGLMGGVQLGLSEAVLPLYVEPLDLKLSEARLKDFDSRLLLIYTGKTRLARNLLQDVVRNWYARNPYIVRTEDALVVLAQECANAFIDGNFEKVGSCVEQYWQMKKRMAPGCESQTIAKIMATLKPYMLGMCSAGAGGGGFIYGILKDPAMRSAAIDILNRTTGLEAALVYEATVDSTGLTVTWED
ncbi:L-fucose kinase-like isoform X2 [Pomacea canaliculata]|uniref:L-fucose kinase-like isoform X2 n=1 Tax=Pomacea canaliculata TaxID=400727 RepID=UPI000D73C2A0|nr:L-fucose kinase-like isoform X2 [Pomacea canaliculata]